MIHLHFKVLESGMVGGETSFMQGYGDINYYAFAQF